MENFQLSYDISFYRDIDNKIVLRSCIIFSFVEHVSNYNIDRLVAIHSLLIMILKRHEFEKHRTPRLLHATNIKYFVQLIYIYYYLVQLKPILNVISQCILSHIDFHELKTRWLLICISVFLT